MNDDPMMDLLESIAEDNDLLLSDNLIFFANAVWQVAYNKGRNDEKQTNPKENRA